AAASFLVVAGAPFVCFLFSFLFLCLSLWSSSTCLRRRVEHSRDPLRSDPAVPVADPARVWWFR
ncbi:unnamed protein product, partial [Brassica oleracea var. botrytis]